MWAKESKRFIAMKRNMVPLLGIAFVAAIVATGVVYGCSAAGFGPRRRSSRGKSIVVAARDLDRGSVDQGG